MLRKTTLIILAIGCLGLSGCFLKPYTVDVQQGNVLNQKTLNKLEIGMSKEQVVALLGTPVLSDTFHKDQWTYVYTNQINGGKTIEKRVDLKFMGNRLADIKVFHNFPAVAKAKKTKPQVTQNSASHKKTSSKAKAKPKPKNKPKKSDNFVKAHHRAIKKSDALPYSVK